MTDEEAWAELVAAVHLRAEKKFTPEMEAKQAAMRKRNHERLVRLRISREDSPDE